MAARTKKKTARKTTKKSTIKTVAEMGIAQGQKSPLTTLLVILVVFLSAFSIYLFQKVRNIERLTAGGTPDIQQPQRPTELKVRKPEKTEHWRGDQNARYVWVEYSDYECPFCKKIHPDMLKLMDENKDKVAWVYRHYPLSFHPNAQKEAEATECATEQGGNDAFWKYTDKVFERTTSNGTGFALTNLGPLAAELSLDQSKFQLCLDSGKYTKKVQDQFKEGSASGVQATPTGVIYDLKTGKTLVVEGAMPFENLKQSLTDFLTKSK